MTRIEDLTPQIDGITRTFETVHAFIGGTVSLIYNGEVLPTGMFIVSYNVNDQTITLDFTPETNVDPDLADVLRVIFETTEEEAFGSGGEDDMQASGEPI